MLLLAMDTSTPAVTVALHDGERVVAESTIVDPRRHTELLMPQVTQVLREAGADRRDVTEIAVGVGPGPFTGLRVGLAAARTMGAVLDLPVRGVCSLDVLAYGVVTARAAAYGVVAGGVPADSQVDGPFVVATDARRREVYWAAYDASGTRTAGPQVGPAAEIVTSTGGAPTPAAGAGARLYPEAFAQALDPEYPSAAHLAAATVDEAVAIVGPEPLYLRRPDAAPPAARKSVLT